MNSSNEKIIVFLYRESVGELNIALPIIHRLKKQFNIEKCFFHFISQDKFEKIDDTYKSLLNISGEITIGKTSFLNLFFQLLNKELIIVSSDKCPHFELEQLKTYFPNSTLLMMHHAQSILYKEKLNKDISKKSIYEIYKPDYFLVGNSIDYENKFYSNGKYQIPEEKVLLIGALNYNENWISKVLESEDRKDKEIKDKTKNFKKTILVTTRTIHKEYMMKEDYYYQVNSIIELAKKYKEFLFIVKPHPREKLKIYEKAFNSSANNLIISTQNAYKLCQYSHMVISFWSSVIQDCAIMNKPVIEFHRHSEKNSKLLIKDANRLKSFFEYYGFCSYVSSKDDLELLINDDERLQSQLKKQVAQIEKIFFIDELKIKESLETILINKKKNKAFSKSQLVLNYFKSLIKLYIDKKLKK